MKKSAITLLVIGGILLLLIIIGVSTYNSLIRGQESVEASYSAIDVQLKRRNDLIPNLVNTVKGYAAHETEAINSVTEARAKLNSASTQQQVADADAELTSALGRLLVIVENYPNLKADANFRQLSDELAGTENRISTARRDYNEAARQFNTKIRTFPTSIIASMMNVERYVYFEAEESEREVPKVEF